MRRNPKLPSTCPLHTFPGMAQYFFQTHTEGTTVWSWTWTFSPTTIVETNGNWHLRTSSDSESSPVRERGSRNAPAFSFGGRRCGTCAMDEWLQKPEVSGSLCFGARRMGASDSDLSPEAVRPKQCPLKPHSVPTLGPRPFGGFRSIGRHGLV